MPREANGDCEPDLDEGLEAERLAEAARRLSDRLTLLQLALARHVEWRDVTAATLASDLESIPRDIAEDELRLHLEGLEQRGVLRWDDIRQTYLVQLPAARDEITRLEP